jgi:hypothetical protein
MLLVVCEDHLRKHQNLKLAKKKKNLPLEEF